MAVIQVLWPDDIPFQGIPIDNFEAGQVSTILQVRIFNDRNEPATGSVLRNNFVSVALQDPVNATNKLTSGQAPLDELWVGIRFVDASPNIDAFNTTFARVGASSRIPFPTMIADSYRTYEIEIRPPSFALTNPYTFFTLIHVNERAYAVPGPGVDVHRGVLTGYGDRRQTTLLSGSSVTATTPTADDEIHISAGHLMFEGIRADFIQEDFTLDDFDGAVVPEQLEAGEAYIAMVTRIFDGTVVIVKSLRADDPIEPPKPLDEIFVAYVRVDFTGGDPDIGQEDITQTLFYGQHFTEVLSGLDIRLYGGNILSSSTWRVTFEVEGITLTASGFNYLYSRSDGSFTVVFSALEDEFLSPDTSSDLLYVYETDVTDVINIDDRRVLIDVTPTGPVSIDHLYPLQFGANLNTIDNYLIANGVADAQDSAPAIKTKRPIFTTGVIRALAYISDSGDTTTEITIVKNGSPELAVLLLNISGQTGVEIFSDIAAVAGDTFELQWTAGTAPADSSMGLIFIAPEVIS